MDARPSHLGWIPAAAAVGFAASVLFGDALRLPVDLYYGIYFAVVLVFLGCYARRTRPDTRTLGSRRLAAAGLLGLIGGLALMRAVLEQPATTPLHGAMLVWALLWRGFLYGAVDGVLLIGFPWVVAWRALRAERGGWGRRVAASGIAIAGVLLVTTSYHLGYGDFRSRKIVQPNVGAVIGSAPTILAANPLAGVLSHVILHVTAVMHAPGTDLFLPPHRDRDP